ncbi:MAG: arylesterase [OCS116 cluster bacterium]|uniref:Arylesterase n=1 Tax=OCS116 cluster bacterium TaxID=2030921 RepID=A0A2A4Z3B3_9PROT|nr:arylesterase [OCS116 cluster bacterium]
MLLLSAVQAAAITPKLFILGDSLTAGYGLQNPDDSFPNKLSVKLKALGKDIEVIDAGISGDTSTAANERLLWALGDAEADNVQYAIIELGANDAFRAISPAQTKLALQDIIDKLAGQNIKIMLAGMFAPPNMGDEYEAEFAAIFTQLAESNDVLFYPFFLDGVAGDLALNQADGIHPTPEGVEVIIVNIMPSLLELIK